MMSWIRRNPCLRKEAVVGAADDAESYRGYYCGVSGIGGEVHGMTVMPKTSSLLNGFNFVRVAFYPSKEGVRSGVFIFIPDHSRMQVVRLFFLATI